MKFRFLNLSLETPKCQILHRRVRGHFKLRRMVDVVSLFPGLNRILIYVVGSSGNVHVEAPATLMAAPLGVRCGPSVAFLCESHSSILCLLDRASY